MWFYSKIMKILFRSEFKAFEKAQKQLKEQAYESFKKEASQLPADQKAIVDQYAKLQNKIFEAFIEFSKAIQASSGPEMEGTAQIWSTTVLGLNKTLAHAFQHPTDSKIREHLKALDVELQLAIDTNQEVLSSKKPSNGGFGYNGPIGEA